MELKIWNRWKKLKKMGRGNRDIERKWKNEINRVGIPTVLYCRLRSRLSEGGGLDYNILLYHCYILLYVIIILFYIIISLYIYLEL